MVLGKNEPIDKHYEGIDLIYRRNIEPYTATKNTR